MNVRLNLFVLLAFIGMLPVGAEEKPKTSVFLSVASSPAVPIIGRLAAHVAIGIAGAPGDIIDTSLGFGNLVSQYVCSMPYVPTYDQVQEKLPVSLPTSEQIECSVTKLLPEGALEPKSMLEKCANFVAIELAGGLTGKLPVVGAVCKVRGIINLVPKSSTNVLSTVTIGIAKKATSAVVVGRLQNCVVHCYTSWRKKKKSRIKTSVIV